MSDSHPRTAETAALAAALQARASVRVPLDELWPLWAQAAPRLVGTPDQAASLAVALNDLARQGIVELPGRAWDMSTMPPLPRSLVVPGARRSMRDRSWMRFPWRAELGWAASLPALSDARLHDLVAINDWLANTAGTTPEIVPVRYRSAEILGDEKALDTMAKTILFGPGRLTYDLLACQRVPAPLPAIPVGSGSDLLVVENSDTYWVAVAQLRRFADHPIGIVAWGSGNAFPSQVDTLTVDVAGRGPIRGKVWYWGDLDPAGLTIATDASRAAAQSGGPSIRPATQLWWAMLSRPAQDVGLIRWTGDAAREWLGDQLWAAIAPIRETAARVAQESVPPQAIATWAASDQLLHD